MEHIRTIINNWAMNKGWEPIEYEYIPTRYDPFEIFKPSKSLLKQCVNNLKHQCYEILQEKRELKKENEATQAICLPLYEQQHQRILKFIKLYEFRLRRSGKENRPSSNGIDQADIERAKQYLIRDLYTGRLRQNGRRLLGKCPFHQDDSPSFVIYEDQNTFHCYGCQANGDAITFIEKLNNLKFIEAVKYLIK